MQITRLISAIFILSLGACSQSSSTKNVSTDSPVADVKITDTATSNTKSDSTQKQYWETLPVPSVAELILKDSIRPITSPVVYSMLDSLTSDVKQTRQYYFKVFNKIMNKADGELAESIGGYALTYVQSYPKDFLENSASFSRNQLEAWAGNIGIELFLSTNQNVKDAFDQIVVLFNDNCKGCNASQLNRLKKFSQMIWKTIKENEETRKDQR